MRFTPGKPIHTLWCLDSKRPLVKPKAIRAHLYQSKAGTWWAYDVNRDSRHEVGRTVFLSQRVAYLRWQGQLSRAFVHYSQYSYPQALVTARRIVELAARFGMRCVYMPKHLQTSEAMNKWRAATHNHKGFHLV